MLYREYITTAENDPLSVDFALLRQLYVQSEDYRPTSHFTYSKLQGNTNACKSFEEVESFCKRVLTSNPMDIEARMLLEFAYDQMEQYDLASHHHGFVGGMLDAIFASGEGKTIETAWQVVAVAEEYTILSVMGLKMRQQSLVTVDSHHFDILTCVSRHDQSAAPMVVCFDITHPYLYLQNMLG